MRSPSWRTYGWRAWLSIYTDTVVQQLDARDRISDGGVIPYEYRLLDGETIVFNANYRFIAGAIPLQNLILLDEQRHWHDGGAVWTGSNSDGTAAYNNACSNWTYLSANGFTGFAEDRAQWCGATNGSTVGEDRKCTSQHPVYCFEVDP